MNKNSWKMRCVDGGNSCWKVGDVIIVKDNKGTNDEYEVDGDFSSFNNWCEERKRLGSKWELIEDSFTKSDLQEGDVVVLRNGERAVYFDQYIRNKNRDLFIGYYDWDMTKIEKQFNQYDVASISQW